MHGSTRDRLEELLAGGVRQNAANAGSQGVHPEPDGHVHGCLECSSELNTMREQAEWMRRLRPAAELEPAPGFYARVLQRIEDRAKRSIWYGLVYSPAGKRLAYASLSLALVLGLYVLAAEQMDRPAVTHRAVMQRTVPEVSGANTPAEQRDAVLVNFASYGADVTQP